MLEKVKNNEKVLKARQHFGENKRVYITGAACLVAGILAARRYPSVTQTLSGEGNTAIGIAKHVTIVKAELERRGHPGNIVRCIETGEVYASQKRAAEALRINPARITEFFQGKNPTAGGYTFEFLGEAQ